MAFLWGGLVLGLVVAHAGPASAQIPGSDPEDIDIEVPVVVFEDQTADTGDTESIDLAQIVQTAARGVTTVQEAPAIVTVITAEEIEDRGLTSIIDIADTVPGWMQSDGFYDQFPFLSTRGTTQGVLFLINSVQMFDPFYNAPSVWRIQPVETVKRIEMITGPGGVLWGANSFLGILNVITKDADDVDGVEAGVRMGDGPGDRGLFRGYVMAGVTDLPLNTDVFLHASFETYEGPELLGQNDFFSSSAPQPASYDLMGPLVRSNQGRSTLFNIDGKVSVDDKLSIYFSAPFTDRTTGQSFTGLTVQDERISDGLDACDPDAVGDDGVIPGACSDPLRNARRNQLDWFDRYAIGEYRTRLADGKAGVTVKGYVTQFVRDFSSLLINQPQLGPVGSALAPPTAALSGEGTVVDFDGTHYRSGANVDGDIELPANARLLYGVEAFHEWYNNQDGGQIQGDGRLTTLPVSDPASLNLPCPADPTDDYNPVTNPGAVDYREGCPLTVAFEANRTVFGGYINPQWKVTSKLTLDAGIRLQGAPDSLSTIGYDLTPIFGGGLVYNFIPNWYFKANYAEGFRPPVFNNLFTNGESIQFDGSEDLDTEESRAAQFEVNARLFRGSRRIRELNFRADYSYTTIDNQILILGGRYQNTGQRAIHSAELLSKLYLVGGHRVELGYTYVDVATEDTGVDITVPNHWFTLSGVFSVIGETLQASTRLRVVSAFEDPNKLYENRDYRIDEFSDPSSPSFGRVINDRNDAIGCTLLTQDGCLRSDPSELVRDRIPPSAELTFGLMFRPLKDLALSAWVYNTLNAQSYQPNIATSLSARQNPRPYQRPNLSALFNAVYTY